MIPPGPEKIEIKGIEDEKVKEWIVSLINLGWNKLARNRTEIDVANMELNGIVVSAGGVEELINAGWDPSDCKIAASYYTISCEVPSGVTAYIDIEPKKQIKGMKKIEYTRIKAYADYIKKVRELERELEMCKQELEKQRDDEDE